MTETNNNSKQVAKEKNVNVLIKDETLKEKAKEEIKAGKMLPLLGRSKIRNRRYRDAFYRITKI